jgi:uncharacterized RDD family membrane protein YckC
MAPTPAATAPDPAQLLLRYRRVLDAVDEVPLAFLVRRRHGHLSWLGHSLRTRFLLRFFVRWHVTTRVADLRRAAYAEAAVDGASPTYSAVSGRLEAFEKSLPPLRLRRMIVVSLVAISLVALLLARAAPRWDPTLSFLFANNDSQATTMRDAVQPLAETTSALLSLSPTDAGHALESFACRTAGGHDGAQVCSAHRALVTSVTSVLFMCFAIWLVTFLPLTAFRLKRTLFNLDAPPDVRHQTRRRAAHEDLAAAQGIYALETEVFAGLGRPRPPELPLDLLCQAAALVVPLWAAGLSIMFGAYGLRWDIENGATAGDATALLVIWLTAGLLASIAAARAGTLRWAYRSRLGRLRCDPGLLPRPASLRRRLAAHLVDTVPFALLGVYLALRVPSFEHNEIGGIVAVVVLVPAAMLVVQGAAVARGGRSVGKAVFGLGVLGPDGCPLGLRRALLREVGFKGVVCGLPWLLLPLVFADVPVSPIWALVPAWSLYVLVHVCATWNVRRSPVHDLVLGTVVVAEAADASPALAPSLAA